MRAVLLMALAKATSLKPLSNPTVTLYAATNFTTPTILNAVNTKPDPQNRGEKRENLCQVTPRWRVFPVLIRKQSQ